MLRHGGVFAALALLCALAALAGGTDAQTTGSTSTCASQLSALPGATTDFVDASTPSDACTIQLCTDNNHAVCMGQSPPLSTLQLVFSDEFNESGRSLAVEDNDTRWTADNMWYAGTGDTEVYRSEQVTTANGSAVITMEKTAAWGISQQPEGQVWNVTKDYKSGFFSSWNKFCYTGGYVEAALQFPGDDYISGFWPAFWLMGNLGRPGYLATTGGFWPYTYNSCGGGEAGLDQPGANRPQNITACPDPPGFDRTKYGLKPGVGRGAPEIDMVEMKVPSSINEQTGQPVPLGLARGGEPGQHARAFNSMTLQVGPLLPNGTTWMDPNNTSPQGPLGPGIYLPQEGMQPGQPLEGMWTHSTYWTGDFAYGMAGKLKDPNLLQNIRPGNVVQDSISAMATLTSDFFTNYHIFGLDWKPREYVRWYIDGVLVYEVNKEALRAQSNGSYTTFERLIPVEAMYIVFNFAMSANFTALDLDRLQFPSQYKIDYVRVYQDPAAINLGCSPPDYPTAQFLACNRDTYIVQEQDQVLIPDVCEQLPSCRSEWGYEYQGGDLYGSDSQPVHHTNVTTPQDCCKKCQEDPKCGAYTWNPYFSNVCALKHSTGWNRTQMPIDYQGIISGVVYDANSTTPRVSLPPV